MKYADEFIKKLKLDARSVIGQAETDWLDFKSQWYWTNGSNEAKGKNSFARDVASFANHNGGVIIIGGKTRKVETERVDKLTELGGVTTKDIDERSMRDTLLSQLYPHLPDVDIEKFPIDDDKSIIIIRIPKAGTLLRPILVRGDFVENKRVDSTFCLPTRFQDETVNDKIESIHGEIKFGRYIKMLLEGVLADREQHDPALKAIIGGIWRHDVDPISNEALETAASILIEGSENEPMMILQGFPREPMTIRGLHNIDSGPAKFFRNEEYGSPRKGGFGWAYYREPEKLESGSIKFSIHGGAVLLSSNGILTCAALITKDNSVLSWAMKSLKINQLALVEMILDFVLRYESICMECSVQEFCVNLRLQNIKGVALSNCKAQDDYEYRKTKKSERQDLSEKFDATVGDAASLAYKIAEHIFYEFGFDKCVPYSKDGRIMLDGL